MLPIGSPENMLRAIGEQAVHGLPTIALYCGVARARHHAALAAAAASAKWRGERRGGRRARTALLPAGRRT